MSTVAHPRLRLRGGDVQLRVREPGVPVVKLATLTDTQASQAEGRDDGPSG
jgi:hypothetical protein